MPLKYKYFYITSFFNNLFLKKNKELWFKKRNLSLNEFINYIQKNFKYTADPKCWDNMFSPEISFYYKKIDCSSFANLWFEYLKFQGITCQLFALESEKSGHAIVTSTVGTFSNMNYYSDSFTPSDYIRLHSKIKYNKEILLKENF